MLDVRTARGKPPVRGFLLLSLRSASRPLSR
jgi:hypothetical protein